MLSKITSCNFENLHKIGNGGAIEISRNDIIHIMNCFFKGDVTSLFGGAFFLEVQSCELKKNYFLECYSSNLTNEVCGNAGFCKNSNCVIEHFTSYKCGPSETQHSDSSIRFNCPVKTKYINASMNYGISGASGISVIDKSLSSKIEYLNVVDPHDICAVESYYDITVYFSNFINTITADNYVFWCHKTNKMKFDSCRFVNTKSTFSNGGSWEAVNCQADISISSMTRTTPEMIKLRVIFQRPLCTKIGSPHYRKHFVELFSFVLLVYS